MRMMKTTLLVCCLCLCHTAIAQDRTQRPLPFPEKNLPGTSAQRELLRQLRSFLDQKQKTNEQPAPTSPDKNASGEQPAGESGLDPSQLGQLGEALQKLKDQLPPGMVPPNLGDIPPEKLQKALSSPETQQRMRKLLEQFQRDGLLPPSGDGGNQPPLPVPPRPDEPTSPEVQPSQPDDEPSLPQMPSDSKNGDNKNGDLETTPNRPNIDDERTAEPGGAPPKKDDQSQGEHPGKVPQSPRTGEQLSEREAQTDPGNGRTDDSDMSDVQNGDLEPKAPEVPMQSLKALEDFLQELSRSANDDSSDSGTAPGESGSGNANSSSPSSDVPNPRQPLRRRDPSGNSPRTIPQPSQPGNGQDAQPDPMESNPPRENGPPGELNSNDSVRNPNAQNPKVDPSAPQSQNGVGADPSGDSDLSQPSDRNEQSQKAMETLQQLLQNEALRRHAEQMLDGNQSPDGSPNNLAPSNSQTNPSGSPPVPGPLNQPRSSADRNQRNGTNIPGQNSDSGSGPGGNRSGNRNGPDTNSPDSPNQQSIEEFLREQMKKMQSQPQPQDSPRQPSPLSPRPNEPRPFDKNAPNGHPANPQGSSPQTPQESQSGVPQKPPIDIAEEVNRRGLKDTLKKIWDNAKEESRREKEAPARSDVAESGSGVDLNEIPADRLLKMLDNFSDDLEKLAKESERSERSERPGRITLEPPRRAPEPPSALSELRKSASEWLSDAVPTKPSPNSGLRSEPVGLSMPSLSAEFDTTPALILAVLLGLAGLALLAGKVARNRAAGNSDAALAALGPPLTPEQIHDRSDVVRAFHQVALKGGHAVEDWWNHRDAALSLAASAPQKESAVSNLVDVYEHARYLPEDVPLTPDKIESARAAVRSLS